MSGVAPKRWLGQVPQMLMAVDAIGDLGERGLLLTELIDTCWKGIMPELAERRHKVILQLADSGLNDGQIAELIGINRQRVSQIRRW